MLIINILNRLKQLDDSLVNLFDETLQSQLNDLQVTLNAYFQQRDAQIDQDDGGISIARYCLLQKDVADRLTSDVIFFLFSSEEGRSMMVMDGLPIYRVIELGFHDNEELSRTLWHAPSNFDHSPQNTSTEKDDTNRVRIINAILSLEADISPVTERTPAHASLTHQTTENESPLKKERRQKLANYPLVAEMTIQDLLDEYDISLKVLLQKNGITLEAIYRHNGFTSSQKPPLYVLYIHNLNELYAIQNEINNAQLNLPHLKLYCDQALNYFNWRCHKAATKYKLTHLRATATLDKQDVKQLEQTLKYVKMQCENARIEIDLILKQLFPKLRTILFNAFSWSDNTRFTNWERITSPADYHLLAQNFIDQFIKYINQELNTSINISLTYEKPIQSTSSLPKPDRYLSQSSFFGKQPDEQRSIEHSHDDSAKQPGMD